MMRGAKQSPFIGKVEPLNGPSGPILYWRYSDLSEVLLVGGNDATRELTAVPASSEPPAQTCKDAQTATVPLSTDTHHDSEPRGQVDAVNKPHRSKDGKAERMAERRKRKRAESIAELQAQPAAAAAVTPVVAAPATPAVPKKVISGPSNADEAQVIRQRFGFVADAPAVAAATAGFAFCFPVGAAEGASPDAAGHNDAHDMSLQETAVDDPASASARKEQAHSAHAASANGPVAHQHVNGKPSAVAGHVHVNGAAAASPTTSSDGTTSEDESEQECSEDEEKEEASQHVSIAAPQHGAAANGAVVSGRRVHTVDMSFGSKGQQHSGHADGVLSGHEQAPTAALQQNALPGIGTPPGLVPRRVYIGGLPFHSSQEELRELWGECGEIEALDMLTFPDTGKFKGIVFVTFKTDEGYEAALQYNGEYYGGKQLVVKPCEAPKRVAAAETPHTDRSQVGQAVNRHKGSAAPKTRGYNVAYVGNIAFDVDAAAIEQFFSSCGVTKVRLHTDKDTNRSKGYAHVHFQDEAGVDKAVAMSGSQLSGRRLKISYAQPPRDFKQP